MAVVYLGLGSNLGEREKNIREAIRLLVHTDVDTALDVLMQASRMPAWDVCSDALEGLVHVACRLSIVVKLEAIAMRLMDIYHERSDQKDRAWCGLLRVADRLDEVGLKV